MHEISGILEVLHRAGKILLPVENGWAVACDMLAESSIEELKALCGNIVPGQAFLLVNQAARIEPWLNEMPDLVWDLCDMTQKSLTLILSDTRNLPEAVKSPDGSVGFRVCTDSFLQTLCQRFRRPVFCVWIGDGSFSQLPASMVSSVDYQVEYAAGKRLNAKDASVIKLGKGNLFELIQE